MTTFYGVSAPLGSGKTTAAIEYAGKLAQAGEKFVIVQPSIKLIDQSVQQFSERWPNVAVEAIHSGRTKNVARELADHTKASSSGGVLFVTHAALTQSTYWHRRSDWHLIVDEAPQVFYHAEFTLPERYDVLLPALEVDPYNIRYSQVLPGDIALLDKMGGNRKRDQVHALFQEFAAKLTSNRWEMFVLSEQWERFQSQRITDGKLLVFGLLDRIVFVGFATTTIMSANLERTVAFRYLVDGGFTFRPHKAIMSRLRYNRHTNGKLLTIHYACKDGNWSKHKRDRKVEIGGETCSVNDLIISGALEVFGDEPFVWLANKDIEGQDPFGGRGVKLPHTSHGLNAYQHIHNAAVLAALNPTPALYAFLDEVGHLDSVEVRQAVYHEAVYQAAGRISSRNLADETSKHIVVADRVAAEALAELYPGAHLRRLPFADLLPQIGRPGRRRLHACDADRVAAHRQQHKARLLAELDEVNGRAGVTESPYSYKVNSLHRTCALGGSVFTDIYSRCALDHAGSINCGDFVQWLAELHGREVAKEDAFLWSPAEFDPNKATGTCRGLANITAIWGVWLDADGGDLSIDEFAAMFPHLTMVIYNSYSSRPEAPRWRVVIPSTCAMTIDVHADIVGQIAKSLNRRGYFSRNQLEKRAAKGQDGKCHGFDTSKFTASSLFYLPAQAAAGRDASFFLMFQDSKRQPIDPFRWIDHSIIDKRPVPEPEAVQPPSNDNAPQRATPKDPKLIRLLAALDEEEAVRKMSRRQERVTMAVDRWRGHAKGTGDQEFFTLAVSLAASGMSESDLTVTLHGEAMFAHGSRSQQDRRRSIPAIVRKLRCAA
jgi:hypothetical protein